MEAQRKEEGLYNLQETSKDSSSDFVRASINYLQALSARRLKEEMEASQRRKAELPSYVKKIMEKDTSLRRILKTGSVTVSQMNQPARSNQKGITNITMLKTFTGGLVEEAPQIFNVPSLLPLTFLTPASLDRGISSTSGRTPQFSQHPLDHTALSDEHRRKYKCQHCPKAFCWSTDLKRHTLMHTGERPFKCIYCPADFTRKFLMQNHVRKYHPDFDCGDAVPSVSKSHNLGGVSNVKKSGGGFGLHGYFKNGLPNPIAKPEVITLDDYEEEDSEELYANSAPPAPRYKFNRGRIMFDKEMYAKQEGEAEVVDKDEVATSMGQHSMYASSTPCEGDEDVEIQHDGKREINCKDEVLVEEDDENSLQKYSAGRNFINANSSGSSSCPIIINVFRSIP